MARVLVVDDDPHIQELIQHFLEEGGHDVLTAGSGPQALEVASRHAIDLVVLDVMLPGLDGREVCRRLRKVGPVPILMVSALGQIHHKLQGFEAGTDDYLAKPFEPAELLARVGALLRRSAPPERPQRLAVGDLVLEPAESRVWVGDRPHTLPAREMGLFALLAGSPGRLFPREQLITLVWGADYAGSDRTVDVYLNRLRTRFPEAEHGYRILPVRGVGYRLESP